MRSTSSTASAGSGSRSCSARAPRGGSRSACSPIDSGSVGFREDAGVTNADATRLAVLIDADNSTASVTTELLEEIAKYGTPTVKRAYGDWTTPHLARWKE